MIILTQLEELQHCIETKANSKYGEWTKTINNFNQQTYDAGKAIRRSVQQ